MGHRDTVFPDGTAAQRPFRIDGDQAFGPGVADMKAGLVMNTFVLEALRRFGAPCPSTGLYTSDEEIASPPPARSSKPRPRRRAPSSIQSPGGRAGTSCRSARVRPLSNWR
jgi:glutamate carboxypeptidase